jgi:formylglycine-generating enzyme required for sulfatase activity
MFRQAGTVALAVFMAFGGLALAAAQEFKPAAGTGHLLPNPFQTSSEPKAAGDGRQITNSIGMKLTLVPAGEFLMGSGESAEQTAAFFKQAYGWDLKTDVFKDERPQHSARITRAFYLGTYDVTRGQFRQFVDDAGYKTDAEKDSKGGWGFGGEKFEQRPEYTWRNAGFEQTDEHPVVNVSWNDAMAFCQWLGRKESKTYRLPTEAEWEYACRAGTTTRYHSGDDPETLAQVDNVADGTAKARFPGWTYTIKASDGFVFTAPVGKFRPNAWGLYDMHGNVYQWCMDWYGPEYYAASPVDDPAGPSSGGGRVRRGGSWSNGPYVTRSASREASGPDRRNYISGFRLVLASDQPGAPAREEPKVVTREEPQSQPQELAVDLGGGVKLELVLIPAGEFLMGSPDAPNAFPSASVALPDKNGAYINEKPQHRVRITKAFYMGKYPVTQEQWEALMISNPSEFKGPKNPVEKVGWDHCQAFVDRLNAKTGGQGGTFVLPTEAQWEYACRAGSTTRYYFGDDESQVVEYAWCEKNSDKRTHPVGEKKPNAWGLYDMDGNVWQWCADAWDPGFYAHSPTDDPTGPTTGGARVIRGGSWFNPALICRTADRSYGNIRFPAHDLGFRIARVASTGQGPSTTVAAAAGPAALAVKEITQDIGGGVKLEMIAIPAGEFQMGSPDSDKDASGDEKPQRRIRITKPFYLGKYLVTQEQWKAVMGDNPSNFQYPGPKAPVERVSWDRCQEFLAKLNAKTGVQGGKYALPTEAQWEYACRAGSGSRFYFGDDEGPLGDYAWYGKNSSRETHPVGQKKPNAWGLYDMYGNVWEWCQDWYDERYYVVAPADDPAGPSSGSERVHRGGSWAYPAKGCRSASRGNFAPYASREYIGLRLARIPTEASFEAAALLALQSVPHQTTAVDKPLRVTVTAVNAGAWKGKLRYSLGTPSPAGAAIDAATGEFTWTPLLSQPLGDCNVMVQVDGPAGRHDQTTFSITVTQKQIAVDLGGGVKLDLVLIPAGEFEMGSPGSEPSTSHRHHHGFVEHRPGRQADLDSNAMPIEKPQHAVRINSSFYLGKYLVTQEQWQAVMGSNPSHFKGPKNPVEQVSWDDCQAFLAKLNAKTAGQGGRFVLPTEAQWEYACRAGSTTRFNFPGSESQLNEYSWYQHISEGKSHPVGMKKPNAWLLYDMTGNVWQWCQDWYEADYYGKSPAEDPEGPATGTNRVFRGGSWNNPWPSCRSANRGADKPGYHDNLLGVRVARHLVD